LSVRLTHFGLNSRTPATHRISHAEKNSRLFNVSIRRSRSPQSSDAGLRASGRSKEKVTSTPPDSSQLLGQRALWDIFIDIKKQTYQSSGYDPPFEVSSATWRAPIHKEIFWHGIVFVVGFPIVPRLVHSANNTPRG